PGGLAPAPPAPGRGPPGRRGAARAVDPAAAAPVRALRAERAAAGEPGAGRLRAPGAPRPRHLRRPPGGDRDRSGDHRAAAARPGRPGVAVPTLAEIERATAPHLGPYKAVTASSAVASTQTLVVVDELASTATPGGYVDEYVLRRGLDAGGVPIPGFA